MDCTYCGCVKEGTKILNGWQYCDIHYESLSKVPIKDKIRGHESKYNIEQDVDFDVVDEMKFRKGRVYQKNEFDDNI